MTWKRKPNGKYNTWRPPKYKNAKEMQKRILEYFKSGVTIRTTYIKQGNKIIATQVRCPTITWLTLFLWFCDRSSFYNQEKNIEFSNTIKKARCLIETEYEEMLRENPKWAIFALKNMGWSDRIIINQTRVDVNQLWSESEKAWNIIHFGTVGMQNTQS